MTKRLSRRRLPPEARRTWDWLKPDTSLWPVNAQHRYQKFEDAIKDYLADEPVKSIEEKYALRISQVQEQLARALQKDQHGEFLGFHALIPSLSLQSYTRAKDAPKQASSKASAYTGLLMKLLNEEDLYDELEARVLGRNKDSKEAKVSVIALQKWLVTELKERGYKNQEYPFNTRAPLYHSLARLVKKIREHNAAEYVSSYGTGMQATNMSVMSGSAYRRERPLPFEEIEIDEHKLHGIGIVRIKVDGIVKRVPADRAVGIAICDRGSGAILGATVCLNPEAKAVALIEAIRSATIPGHVVKLPSGEVAPPFRACDFLPELAGAVWTCVYIDNAKIHTGDDYLAASARIGAHDCFGVLRSWSGRPNIENVFSRVVCNKFDRLPSTTSPKSDPKRSAPAAEHAISREIDHDQICSLFYQCLGEINTEPGAGLLYQSPVQVLGDYLKSGHSVQIRRLPPSTAATPEVGVKVLQVSVRRRSANNPNLYINYETNKYSNERLSRRADLHGGKILIHAGPNLRTVNAFELNGNPLGILTADGIWGKTDHTVEIKHAVNRDKVLKFGQFESSKDVVQSVLQKSAKAVLKKHNKRPVGGVVKGALELQHMMQVTNTPTLEIKTPKVEAPASTIQSAAEHARLALALRKKLMKGKE